MFVRAYLWCVMCVLLLLGFVRVSFVLLGVIVVLRGVCLLFAECCNDCVCCLFVCAVCCCCCLSVIVMCV